MTPERWRKIEDLFHLVADAEPAAQAALLEQHCAGDGALRREIEALLGAPGKDGFLQAPIQEVAQSWRANETDLSGQDLGAYHLLEQIGRGGMGVVYRALDSRLERSVALKLLPPEFVYDAAHVRRFRQEARAISSLNHPNILTIHEIGEAETTNGSTHFIATEFVAGRTLRAALQAGDLTLGVVLDVLIQTASALVAAHQAGVVHRDLKPENLMLRPDGVVKVLDFGLAKLTRRQREGETERKRDKDHSLPLTNPGLVMGTVSYMSPEQARGLEVDERTDIFSLGVVAYELLTGQPAFSGTTTGDVLASLFEQEPPPLSRQAPHLPVALQHSINRAIAKDRSARYAKCADLLSDVKALKQELEVAAHLKRPGDAPINTASLGLRVGHAANGHTNHAERAAVQTAQAAAPTTRKSLWLPSGKPLVQAAACVVLLVGALLIWRQWNPSRARSFNAIASIAVLPFVNASGDSQMEYLSDGLTEALMQSLSQLSGLRVMSRGAVFAYKGREIDPRQVGQDLAVAALVSGRIQQQGERLIIQTEMVNTADGARLWGGRYDRLQSDAQTVQAEIAREISTRLQAHLRTEERRELAARPAANSEAYRLYLLGRHLHYQITRENFPHVLGLYQRAIAADARLALAHSGVAHVYADASSQYLPPAQAIPQAKQAALTALSLDDNLPEAHLAVALVQFWGDWDWPGAEKTFNRTLALNPNYSAAHAYYASLLAVQKRFDEALRAIQRAEELDPSSAGYSASVASIYYVARQYDRAEAKARHMLTVHPQGVGASNAHSTLG